MSKKKQNRKLSVRQKKYAKYRVTGMSKQKAALKAGYSPATAKNVEKNIEERGVGIAIADMLRNNGLGEEEIMAIMKEALAKSTRIWTTKDKMYERPDYEVKRRYIDMILKLLDKYPAVKKAIEHSGEVSVNSILDAATSGEE